MPLTEDGFIADRAADFLTIIQEDFEARLVALGITPDIDWESDTVFGVMAAVLSVRLGGLSEALQAVYDARDINNAQGAQLDAVGLLQRVIRNEATHSVATVTLSGDPFTVIPAGRRVEGGGVDGRARWATIEDVTLDSGGDGSVQVEAEDAGPTEADAGTIDAIVDLVTGWDTVTNAAAAEPGRERETDAAYRLRIVQRAAESAAAAALRARLRELDYLEAVLVLENDTSAAASVLGVTVDPRAVAVVLYPSTLTPAQMEEVASVIYRHVPMGISTSPIASPDESRTVDGADGLAKTIRWSWAADVPILVTATLTLEDGYTIADVEADVKAAVAAYVESLAVGAPSFRFKMGAPIAAIEGINNCVLTQALNPASPSAQDLTPTAVQRLTLHAAANVVEA